MGEIGYKERAILAEACNLAGLDFTVDEQERINELTDELKRILEGAKHRMRDRGQHSLRVRTVRNGGPEQSDGHPT